ncbi:MAG TPA: YgjV family protein [Candidatus Eisenbergiella merdipullorum]|uniref:YgjV family protein n=1 Tax=Candidatus Eisenbergiella merdipullorum TaxID=2838553 RepID=A0A9D2I881_9FIRM|nr:YgjV family protein [Candidatus Eisenbergiella merdipullorum]
MGIVTQLFGIGAMVSLFIVYQQKTRKKLIAAKLSADIFWVLHYFCLGGIAGMIPNFIGIFRELIFINRQRRKWADSVIWPVLFILLTWCLGARTFHSLFNILPITASTFVTISLWINDPKLTKIISVPVSLSFFLYDIYVRSYIGMINELISITSILLFFIKERIRRKRKEQR